MGRLRAGQALGDLPDTLLFSLLQWYETTGESGPWVECHQEITHRLHQRQAPTASRNTPAPDQHIHAKEESSSGNCNTTGNTTPGGHCSPGN